MIRPLQHKLFFTVLFIALLCIRWNVSFAQHFTKSQHFSQNDTIVSTAVIYEGDTIEAMNLQNVDVYGRYTEQQRKQLEAWTKLRNAVYVTYPYAKRASLIINDINAHLANVTDEAVRKNYIKTREKELRQEFEKPLTNLTVYQGQILMKLINRETGNNCYDIIKEYKGGITARVYQTVAFFFDTSLKQPYDANGDDAAIEKIVLEVQRMYGYKS